MQDASDRQLEDLRENFVWFSRKAYDMGYVCATGGNLSVLTPQGNGILIKTTSVSFRDLTKRDVILAGLDGSVKEGTGRPSKEIHAHLAIYKIRPDVRAVIHMHSPAATAFAVAARPVPLVTVQSELYLKEVPIVKYAAPGSRELAEFVAATFKDPKITVALLEKHGTIAVGNSIPNALDNAELLEHTARIALYLEKIRAS